VAPRARIEVGRYFVANGIPAAMIDLSDGLAGDLRHICEESDAGVVLEEALLPIDPDLARLADALGRDPLEWVLGPSDDYELICAVPRAAADPVFALPGALGIPIAVIGEVTDPPRLVVLRNRAGTERELGPGWDHFAPDRRRQEEP
jgi:thiamine-monophosphate kinase